LFSCWIGDHRAMDTLYRLKEEGVPQALWTVRNGVGVPYLPGHWVIETIAETQTDLSGSGQPGKVEWSINLLRYD